ncbi:low-density lipoprotein receptor-related protein 11 [Gastrophryne carolinensis]
MMAGVRQPVIRCLALLSLLLWCGPGGCRRASSPGSPAPQLTDLRSQISGVEELLEEFRKQLQQQQREEEGGGGWLEARRQQQQGPAGRDGQAAPEDGEQQQQQEEEEAAMQRQLQEVAVRPAGEGGEELCNFSRQEDYIIRTKDSLEAGATFLRAPAGQLLSWKQCLELCCAEPRCSAAVTESSGRGLSCFLFDCSPRGRHVCRFSPHRDYSSFTLTGRNTSAAWTGHTHPRLESDKPPISNAGEDVVLQLPVDWVILDGRESTDDHAIVRYEWALLRGDPLVEMKYPQPGTLKLLHLQEGVYTLQLTVTDTSGQKSSDNVSVSVIPAEHQVSASKTCTGACSRYQFLCDDGCCIDITLACDRVVQCPDGSDEAFCQNFGSGRKTVIHITEKTEGHGNSGKKTETEEILPEEPKGTEKISVSVNTEKSHTLSKELPAKSLPNTVTVSANTDKDLEEKNFFISKDILKGSGHPAPETGAVLPLALGLAITSLLLLMVVCRLQLVRQKLKKARPLTAEESDYLINGMYL